MTLPVLSGVRGPAEAVVVRELESAGGFPVVRRCADLAEVLAAAETGLGRVAVLGPRLPGLDLVTVTALRRFGVRVVVLAETTAEAADARATGCDAVVLIGEDLVTELLAALEEAALAPAPAGANGTSAPKDARADGRLVAVWGPTGAPGRTTVAVNLAAEFAEPTDRPGRGALLVDADTHGAAVAQTLGMLDEAAGIVAAVRTAALGRLDVTTLAALAPVLPGGLRVLTGITRSERWPEIPPAALAQLWPVARRLAAVTVVDCGFGVEQDEALTYDTAAPQRHGVTLGTLGAADDVVVVGSGDPIGLQRLVGALERLGDLTTARRHVVVNRVRASAVGPAPETAVRAALRRYAAVEEVHLIPDDRATVDHAVLTARTLAEAAPSGAAYRAISALAERFALSAPVPVGAH